MSEDPRKVIRVSAATDCYIRDYAERRGITITEAADALVATAIKRLRRLDRYATRVANRDNGHAASDEAGA